MTPSTKPSVSQSATPSLTSSDVPIVTSGLFAPQESGVSTSIEANMRPSPSQLLSQSSHIPTVAPSAAVNLEPSMTLSTVPTLKSSIPTIFSPENDPTMTSTLSPRATLTLTPSEVPTVTPTVYTTLDLNKNQNPEFTSSPSTDISLAQSNVPTMAPSTSTSPETSTNPSAELTVSPSVTPTLITSDFPTSQPSISSLEETEVPTAIPFVSITGSLTLSPVHDTPCANASVSFASVQFAEPSLHLDVHFSSSVRFPLHIELFSTFSCNLIFSGLHGVDLHERCSWISTSYLRLLLDRNSSIIPGSLLTFSNDTLFSFEAPTFCNESFGDTAIVQQPFSVPTPTVDLIVPERFGPCDDVSITLAGLSGSGGRQFTVFSWSISPDLATMEEVFGDESQQLTVIPNHLLDVTINYTITLTIENYFGVSRTFECSVLFSSQSIPLVNLDHTAIEMLRHETLQLVAEGQYSACPGSQASLQYSWSITDAPTIQSISDWPSIFYLPSFVLNSGQIYEVVITVSQGDLQNQQHCLVTVLESNLVAAIAGGSLQTFGYLQNIVLDASYSLDPDVEDEIERYNGLQYIWSCSSNGKENCSSTRFPHTSETSAVYSFSAAELGPGTFMISLEVSKNGRFSQTSIMITISADEYIPQTSIDASSTTMVSVSEKVRVYGSVQGNYDAGNVNVTASWASWDSSLLLSAVASTSVTMCMQFQSDSAPQSFNLVIPPQSLVGGYTYTIRLEAWIQGTDISGYSEIDVYVNAAPSAGVLSVSPSAGEAWSTEFSFMSIYWEDDADSLPLLYSFSHELPSSGELVIQALSMSAIATGILLPALMNGQEDLTCFGYAYDQYGAFDHASEEVAVTPVMAENTSIATLASQTFHECSALGNLDCLGQTVGMLVMTLSGVDCSRTDPSYCAGLNREPCGAVENTCGDCLEGYSGLPGEGNTQCVVPVSACANGYLDSDSESDQDCGGQCIPCISGKMCQDDGDCLSQMCVDGICQDTLKECPSSHGVECNGQGDCTYTSQQEGAEDGFLLICVESDLSCIANCVCNEDYFGTACQYTEESYSQREEAVTLSMEMFGELMSITESGVQGDADNMMTILSTMTVDMEGFTDDSVEGAMNGLAGVAVCACNSGSFGLDSAKNMIGSLSNILEYNITNYLGGANPEDRLRGRQLVEDATNFPTAGMDVLINLGAVVLSDLVVGEEMVEISSGNVKFLAGPQSGQAICQNQYKLPLTSEEILGSIDHSSVMLQGCPSSVREASHVNLLATMMKNTNGPDDLLMGAVIHADITIMEETPLQDTLSPNAFLFVLTNDYPVDYATANASYQDYWCEQGTHDTVVVNCTGGAPVKLHCWGVAGRWNFTCPVREESATCVVYDHGTLTWREDVCHLVHQGPSSTVCSCPGDFSTNFDTGCMSSGGRQVLSYDVGVRKAITVTPQTSTFVPGTVEDQADTVDTESEETEETKSPLHDDTHFQSTSNKHSLSFIIQLIVTVTALTFSITTCAIGLCMIRRARKQTQAIMPDRQTTGGHEECHKNCFRSKDIPVEESRSVEQVWAVHAKETSERQQSISKERMRQRVKLKERILKSQRKQRIAPEQEGISDEEEYNRATRAKTSQVMPFESMQESISNEEEYIRTNRVKTPQVMPFESMQCFEDVDHKEKSIANLKAKRKGSKRKRMHFKDPQEKTTAGLLSDVPQQTQSQAKLEQAIDEEYKRYFEHDKEAEVSRLEEDFERGLAYDKAPSLDAEKLAEIFSSVNQAVAFVQSLKPPSPRTQNLKQLEEAVERISETAKSLAHTLDSLSSTEEGKSEHFDEIEDSKQSADDAGEDHLSQKWSKKGSGISLHDFDEGNELRSVTPSSSYKEKFESSIRESDLEAYEQLESSYHASNVSDYQRNEPPAPCTNIRKRLEDDFEACTPSQSLVKSFDVKEQKTNSDEINDSNELEHDESKGYLPQEGSEKGSGTPLHYSGGEDDLRSATPASYYDEEIASPVRESFLKDLERNDSFYQASDAPELQGSKAVTPKSRQSELPSCTSLSEFDAEESGWSDEGDDFDNDASIQKGTMVAAEGGIPSQSLYKSITAASCDVESILDRVTQALDDAKKGIKVGGKLDSLRKEYFQNSMAQLLMDSSDEENEARPSYHAIEIGKSPDVREQESFSFRRSEELSGMQRDSSMRCYVDVLDSFSSGDNDCQSQSQEERPSTAMNDGGFFESKGNC